MGIHFYISPNKETTKKQQKCLDEVKAEKVLEKEVLKGTEKSSEITSKESPNQLSDDWHDEVVSNESQDSSTKKPEEFPKSSLKTSFGMPLLTPSTPRERPSPLL